MAAPGLLEWFSGSAAARLKLSGSHPGSLFSSRALPGPVAGESPERLRALARLGDFFFIKAAWYSLNTYRNGVRPTRG